MKVISLEESNTNIRLFLLKNVKDVKSLKEKIISGELDCCAVKPSLIINCFQIVVAANKAAINEKIGKLATKCLNTELLFNLSISRNITQSLNTFGIGEKDEHILIVIFEKKGESKFDCMKDYFQGEICDAEEINQFSDIKLIKKTYKITDKELEVSQLLDSIVSRIATKDLGSF
ncbi:hypothetical protein RUM44_010952 [Polyplax serrata]|uniref:Uncharacterized protein n=1 Tax=Polyplax serrata TaxID=468196 RepID=A0ABR1AQ74_POLSC